MSNNNIQRDLQYIQIRLYLLINYNTFGVPINDTYFDITSYIFLSLFAFSSSRWQMLYDRLEQSINEGGDPSDMENIINALNIRTGSFGLERKNLLNGLFKTMIEVSFPNFVNQENKGIFDDSQTAQNRDLNSSQLHASPGNLYSSVGSGGAGSATIISDEKRKKLSKYQLEELRNREGFEQEKLNEWDQINLLLDLTPEQNQKLKQEQKKILEQKEHFKNIIDTLLQQKKELFKESGKMELCLQRLRSYLTTEQTAKFLLIMEKYKSKKELNLFKLWGIKKISTGGFPQHHHSHHRAHLYDKLLASDDEGGLPESGEEDEDEYDDGIGMGGGGFHKRAAYGNQQPNKGGRTNFTDKSTSFNKDTHHHIGQPPSNQGGDRGHGALGGN